MLDMECLVLTLGIMFAHELRVMELLALQAEKVRETMRQGRLQLMYIKH